MGEVIGPIDTISWLTLKDLNQSINFYYTQPNGSQVYKEAIKREKNLFNYCLDYFR